MHRRPLLGLLLSLVLLIPAGFAGTASARDSATIERILKHGKLRVGMSGSQPPLNARSRTGEVIGMEVDLARLLAGSMGVELEIVEKPFAELLPALRKREIDLVMSGVTITPARNLEFAFVGPYFISGKSILTRSATFAQARETADINRPGVRLAALASSTSQEFVETFASKTQLVTTPDYDSAVKLVVDGEVDALVADYPICLLSVFRDESGELVTLGEPLTIEPIGMALPPSDPLFQNLVQNYLTTLRTSGALEKLHAKWLDDSSWVTRLP